MASSAPFTSRLRARAAAAGSALCLGIDPRPAGSPLTHPQAFDHDLVRVAAAVTEHAKAVLDATHEVIACCKPQVAFFEALGLPGLQALADVMAHARTLGLPVILDAKRGDIGSTAEAYARAYLHDGAFSADALTVNPYLGMDTLEPFIDVAALGGRGLFVLVRTSNPGSATLQGLELTGGDHLYQRLADLLTARSSSLQADEEGYTLLGGVVGATTGAALQELRRRLPSGFLLVPGLGAQGGDPHDVALAFDERGSGAIVNASRAIMYPPGAPTTSLSEAGQAARAAADHLNSLLASALAERD